MKTATEAAEDGRLIDKHQDPHPIQATECAADLLAFIAADRRKGASVAYAHATKIAWQPLP
jgi:hypothetical protein